MIEDQPFIWKSILGEPVIWMGLRVSGDLQGRSNSVSHMDGVSDMEGTSLQTLSGEGLEKGQWSLLTLMPDTSVSP